MSETTQSITLSVGQIAAALAKAQGEMVQPEKNKTVTVRSDKGNYSFDYADYNAIVEAVRGPLSKNGIAFTHLIEGRERGLVLVTLLIHSSGEQLESLYPLPASTEPKTLGGAITYGKRYCLSALTGCVADDDTDAEPENVTSFKDRAGSAPKPQNPGVVKPPGASTAPSGTQAGGGPAKVGQPTATELGELWSAMTKKGWQVDKAKLYMEKEWGIKAAKDLTREQYAAMLKLPIEAMYAMAAEPGSQG